jgi:cytoskeletal protein CcmA (bactofilin family)
VSCPDGVVLAAYAAGDLEPLARRDAEVHLVRCRECRAHLLALREAGARAALEAPPDSPAPEEPQGFGFAVGFLIALGLTALALAALGRGDSLLRPSGVYAMAFDFLFFVRGRVPGLLELVVALAATGSVAAIAALGVSSLARRLGPPLLVALAVGAALAPRPAAAFDLRRAEAELRVPAEETVSGSLVASAMDVVIEGRVDGDLFVTGERVRIAGTIAGNVFAWARHLEIAGRVEGSVHAASEELVVTGAIDGSGYLAAESLRQLAGARIARDAYVFAWSADLAGDLERDVHFHGDRLAVSGKIARDLEVAHADRFALRDGASVGRDLDASVAEEDGVEIAPGARIGGARSVRAFEGGPAALWHLEPWLWLLVRVGAALAFGVALYALLPGLFRVRVPTASTFLRLLGLGLAALVATPLVLLVVAATLVGLPLALLGGFLYLTALYLAHVLAAAEVGRTLLRRRGQDLPGLATFARILLVGLVVVALAGHVPILGPAVRVVILLVGLGLLADQVRAVSRTPRPA